ncbi:MAG: histidine--tRNA ligase [Anaerohalosphaeraceae bacterium]|nr:histidine--tRNA ligase [Anaerohalosphaeraceae bacterium]
MKIPSVKGTRDFYPDVMSVRNFIIDGWKGASVRSNFVEYDGPIFEYLTMYQQKSGDEIASQLFAFTDRGGRDLAIRPEITPTLARMVNQRINALPKPIKWFSVPRLCRAERPQKGRLREFFQWNVDIIGVDDVLADAETIFCAVDYLRQVGLTSSDVAVRISSRKMLAVMLKTLGIADEQLNAVYAVLDKRSKIPAEAFEKILAEAIADEVVRSKVAELMAVESVEQLDLFAAGNQKCIDALDELKQLFSCLESMGIADYCKFDIGIVRGLAYYTGVVFEIYDTSSSLRAICGGGRYDNLLADFGGPKISATGFGMGDCVLAILLEEKGLLPKASGLGTVDCYVACLDEELRQKSVKIAAKLRASGICAEFSYKSGNLGKQLKQASALNAKSCIILGQEFKQDGKVVLKDMAEGSQQIIAIEELFKQMQS